MTDIFTAVAFPTDLIAATVGGLLGFGGAIWASTVQSRRDDRRALRTELTHTAVAFIEYGGELAYLNKEVSDLRRWRSSSELPKNQYLSERVAAWSTILDRRDTVEAEMRKTVQFIRIGYPQLADAAKEFYDSISQADLPHDEREHVDLVYLEILPEAIRRFEMAVRVALGGKKPRHWRAELTLDELLHASLRDAADGKRPKRWARLGTALHSRPSGTARTDVGKTVGSPRPE